MNYRKPIKFLIIGLVLLSLFFPHISGEHAENHETFELSEGYFQGIDMDNLFDTDIEIEITTNYKIDVVILTDDEFNSCCSENKQLKYLLRIQELNYQLMIPQ